MTELLQFLNSIYPLSEGLQEYLLTHLVESEIPKKDYLLKKGRLCENIYFIQKGLVRCFYMDHDREVCSWFMCERDVIISVESFFMQQESKESIQALEDCTLYSISYKELQYAYENFMEFNYIGRVLTAKYYMLAEQRLYSLRMQTTQERYRYLMDHFPQIILRVPSKDIASYLGRAEGTLSRNKGKKYRLFSIFALLFTAGRMIFHRIF